MGNLLSVSRSPYLLQHAANPVWWHEWSDEAFEQARQRNVPIFLSIGYAACHWCHVMAHESFEDSSIAEILNERYVSIKVDREERPDLDAIYMEATTALTGHGGWPMSVFLDHEGRPFYAGTYFPPVPRGGMPSFGEILLAIDRTWQTNPQEVAAAAERISNALNAPLSTRVDESLRDLLGHPSLAPLAMAAVGKLVSQHDDARGGFGGAPKFPPSMVLDFLISNYLDTKNPEALRVIELTCQAMGRGGIYDQLGGGFARYSVDANWVVPHFEKMLYDNALLLRVYARLYGITGDQFALRVAEETAAFLIAEMTTDQGGFASSLDADSDGKEGTFYVWSESDLVAVLGDDDGQWAAALLGVTPAGTFEDGKSTLQLRLDPSDWPRWQTVKQKLLAARALRKRPPRDDKVIASWNAMAISGLVELYKVTKNETYLKAALKSAILLRDLHLQPSGEIRRVSLAGQVGAPTGVLEDYAATALAFFELTDVTGDLAWREIGDRLITFVMEHFIDQQDEMTLRFFDTPKTAERLFKRPQDLTDNATPAGGALMAQALAKSSFLSHLASLAVTPGVSLVKTSPRFAGAWLQAIEMTKAPACTVEGCK